MVSAALLACASLPTAAAELSVVGTIKVPASDLYSGDDAEDQAVNMSGMVCPAPDWCLVASDEARGVHRLKVKRGADGRPTDVLFDAALDLGAPPEAFRTAHGLTGKLKEFDLEAVASTGDQVFFFGSHAYKRKKGEPNPGSHLVAIASVADLKDNTEVPATWVSLDALFRSDPVLDKVRDKQLQCGGLNIEGATIQDGQVLIGFRIPALGTEGAKPAAYVVSTPLAGFAREDFTGAMPHELGTDTPFIGIRSLETVGDDVLVITGDSGVSDLEDMSKLECDPALNKEDPTRLYQLRVWKPASGDSFAPDPIPPFDAVTEDGDPAKLEGIAADPGRPGSFFIVYDGSDKIRYLTDLDLN